jgi:hypothetical protein
LGEICFIHLQAGVLERVVIDAHTSLHTSEGVQITITGIFCASKTTRTCTLVKRKQAQDVLLEWSQADSVSS